MRSIFTFLYSDSLMYQSADLSWKIAVEIAGCAFAYFWGGQKYNGRLQIRSSFKKNFFQKAFEKKKMAGTVVFVPWLAIYQCK